jgi:hypothetical protein
MTGGKNRPTAGGKQADKREKGRVWQVEENDQQMGFRLTRGRKEEADRWKKKTCRWEAGWQEGERKRLAGGRKRPADGIQVDKREKGRVWQVEEKDLQMGSRLTRGRKDEADRGKKQIDKRKEGWKHFAICNSIRTDYFIHVILRWGN